MFSCTAEDDSNWLREFRYREVDGRRVLNPQQYRVVSKVANRVVDEMKVLSKGAKEAFADIGEPIRWCVHGGSGTGKSHTIKILRDELFGELLQWNMSVEFQIVAFQVVMTDLLGGDTVHHALNIGIFDKCFKRREGSNEKKIVGFNEVCFATSLVDHR